jgi:plastocyanin domain-containing protein
MVRIALLVCVALVACKKEAKETKAPPPPPAAVSPAKDGTRRVAIEAGTEGYVPDKIPGKPGEKLMLVFTRTVDSSCLAQVKTPDGKLIDLPKGTPVEVAITVPQTGELTFACGMDMYHGVIVADPRS